MKSKISGQLLITTVLCLLPIALGLAMYDKLPDQVAVHFDAAGTPDNYMPKAAAIFGLPFLFAVINAYSHFRVDHDPRSENASPRLKQIAKWAIPVVSLIAMPITMFLSIGKEIPLPMIIQVLVGLIIILCGNYLPKCKQNFTVGFKLPWTLNNTENWNKTNRLAGALWVACGLLLTANAFIKLPYAGIALLAMMVIVPPAYSYLIYSSKSAKQ